MSPAGPFDAGYDEGLEAARVDYVDEDYNDAFIGTKFHRDHTILFSIIMRILCFYEKMLFLIIFICYYINIW